MRITIGIFLSLLLLNCGKSADKEDSICVYEDIPLEPITHFDWIDGCGCYFSLSDETGHRILIFNYEATALIKLGGKEIFLKSSGKNKSVYLSKDKHTFENENYSVEVLTEDGKPSGDEVMTYEGELRLIIKESGKTFVRRIHGECGC